MNTDSRVPKGLNIPEHKKLPKTQKKKRFNTLPDNMGLFYNAPEPTSRSIDQVAKKSDNNSEHNAACDKPTDSIIRLHYANASHSANGNNGK